MPSSKIEVPTPQGEHVPAYLAMPETVSGPTIVILQEIFGINANVRGIADDYASRGYIAIAPDLFWRQQAGVDLNPGNAEDRELATQLMKGLDQPLAVQDALAAAVYAKALPGASGKVGVVGYCLGGKLAYLMAMEPGVDAAVSYYGVAIQSALDKAGELRAPLLLHIAQEDHLCPPEAQSAIKAALTHIGSVTILDYPAVGHAFARTGGQAFDAASAQRADAATAAFFEKNLR